VIGHLQGEIGAACVAECYRLKTPRS
jgi:hypothetical protein